jgi:hypothetical protein
MIRWLVAIALGGLIGGCATVKEASSFAQPLNKQLVVAVGDVVIRVDSRKTLPTAFGKADVFGRTTPTGVTFVTYAGQEDGKAVFIRRTTLIETGATTMNSTALFIPNTSTTTTTGMVGRTPVTATSTTTGPPTVIMPRAPVTSHMQQGDIAIRLDVARLPSKFLVSGAVVTVLASDEGTVTYKVEQAEGAD